MINTPLLLFCLKKLFVHFCLESCDDINSFNNVEKIFFVQADKLFYKTKDISILYVLEDTQKKKRKKDKNNVVIMPIFIYRMIFI